MSSTSPLVCAAPHPTLPGRRRAEREEGEEAELRREIALFRTAAGVRPLGAAGGQREERGEGGGEESGRMEGCEGERREDS